MFSLILIDMAHWNNAWLFATVRANLGYHVSFAPLFRYKSSDDGSQRRLFREYRFRQYRISTCPDVSCC